MGRITTTATATGIAALTAGAAFTVTGTAHAATFTWTGDINNLWDTPGNWITSDVGATPPPGEADSVIFDADADGDKIVTHSGTERFDQMTFLSSGWLFNNDGNEGEGLRASNGLVHNAGGVNTIATTWRVQSDQNITVGASSTLVFSGGLDSNRLATYTGGGLVVFDTTAGPSGGNRGFIVDGATLLVNGSTSNASGSGGVGSNRQITVTSGTLGGIGTLAGTDEQTDTYIRDTATLAPGGDGTYGDVIGTLTVNADDVVMETGSTLSIDLGTSAGISDILAILQGDFDVASGVTLDLQTTGPLAIGDYTIVNAQSITGNGAFDSVLLDGQAAGSDVQVLFNADNIVVRVIPEPASLALMGLGALMCVRRRRSA